MPSCNCIKYTTSILICNNVHAHKVHMHTPLHPHPPPPPTHTPTHPQTPTQRTIGACLKNSGNMFNDSKKR